MDRPQARIPPAEGATPALAQWFVAKAAHPDALVFFRMGDFFELFFGDAEEASSVLDIALSYRGTHRGNPVAMCGVPAHAHEAYLARLSELCGAPIAFVGVGPDRVQTLVV